MTTLVAHGGTAGLLVESLILVVPVLILGLFMLATRRQRNQDPAPTEVESRGER